ncbi:MAG: hypothetical protein J0G99_13515 [Alphaproteobacteria bacterium]|nr:hypothetical protein [Alphaproteobacteria bacterium]
MKRRTFLLGTAATLAAGMMPLKAAETFTINAPMDPPEWALLERELLHAHTAACVTFFKRYFDQATGWLETTPRWGGDDGPDDAIENVNDWPHLYALGGDEIIRQMYTKAYEGHVQQYTEAKTTDVPIAKLGMYFKEFPAQFDWQHNGEGLTVFNLMPLGAPYSQRYRERVRRFAGFYMDEDPGAPNYDPKLKLIKSLMNGSRGPMLREATALDWTGDPIDVKDRFPSLGHGENDYKQMLAHFQDYGDVVGDHPLNLASTQLATNAYMLTHDQKYKDWVLGYCDAWAERARANGGIIPSKVGLDGKIGGPENKWYAGTYGWGFSPIVPMTGDRQDRNRVPWCVGGFYNAYLLSKGDDKYLDVWRKTADKFDAAAKTVDGKLSAPTMYGDQGFYSFKPGRYNKNFLEIYALSMKPSDRARCEETDWYHFLEGKNPGYPVKALRAALVHMRKHMEEVDADTTSPDMRLADSALEFNPASIMALTQLIEGGLYLQHGSWARSSMSQGGTLLFTRLRYFDPDRRRAGLPPDVAVLVDSWSDDGLTATIVNISPSKPRSVIVQGGAYAEHQIVSVSDGKTANQVNAPQFPLRLEPGAGARLTIKMKRFANDPTLSFPWEGTVADLGNPPAQTAGGGHVD